jgi:hypothetical protein
MTEFEIPCKRLVVATVANVPLRDLNGFSVKNS